MAHGSPRLAELSEAARYHFRWIAFGWMLAITIFNGVNLALKKPTLAAYPGTHDDSVMRVLMFTALTGCLACMFKFPAVAAIGPWLERRLHGDARQVRLGDVWQPGIRAAALWGGGLQFLYQVALVALVTEVSPAGISAAKACVIVPLALLELYFRLMKPKGKLWWLRLASSMLFTLVGAGIVIFEGGFKLFAEAGWWALAALLAFTFLGNGMLAYAEIQEYRGVNDATVAAPVYSLARVLVYAVSGVVGVLGWGTFQTFRGVDSWGTAMGVVHMCIDRWYLVLPIALIGAICDTSRMCVKVLITTTFMYIMLAMAAPVDVILQYFFKRGWPDIYDNVMPGERTLVIAGIGSLVLMLAILLHPKPKKNAPQPEAVTTTV